MPTQVKELMKKNPVIIEKNSTLREAAEKMRSIDCGVLPVGTWEKLEGIITDRDIVIRAVASGTDIMSAKVSDYMTTELCFCNETDTLEQAAEKMCQHNVSRLIIQDQNGNPCGILTFGAILRKDRNLQEISKVVECAVGNKAA